MRRPGRLLGSPEVVPTPSPDPDGTIACWGENTNGHGELMCWGWDSHNQLVPTGGSFSIITSGWWHTIGLCSDGELVQWGWRGPGGNLENPPVGPYLAAAAGHYHAVDFSDLIVVLNGWGAC